MIIFHLHLDFLEIAGDFPYFSPPPFGGPIGRELIWPCLQPAPHRAPGHQIRGICPPSTNPCQGLVVCREPGRTMASWSPVTGCFSPGLLHILSWCAPGLFAPRHLRLFVFEYRSASRTSNGPSSSSLWRRRPQRAGSRPCPVTAIPTAQPMCCRGTLHGGMSRKPGSDRINGGLDQWVK